jgi:hypothetical protein
MPARFTLRFLVPVSFAILAILLAAGEKAQAQDGILHWVHTGNGYSIPPDAFVGGSEDGQPLFVCRAPYLAGVYPGKVVKGNCNISYDGHEIYQHDYEVLAGAGGHWGPPQPNLAGAFIAGGENGGPLFLCQAEYHGGLHPGKIYDGKCDVSYDGSEEPVRHFNVLYAGVMTAPGVFNYGVAQPGYYGQPPPPLAYAQPMGMPTSCSIGGGQKCAGCSVSCPAGHKAICKPAWEGIGKTCGFQAECRCAQ